MRDIDCTGIDITGELTTTGAVTFDTTLGVTGDTDLTTLTTTGATSLATGGGTVNIGKSGSTININGNIYLNSKLLSNLLKYRSPTFQVFACGNTYQSLKLTQNHDKGIYWVSPEADITINKIHIHSDEAVTTSAPYYRLYDCRISVLDDNETIVQYESGALMGGIYDDNNVAVPSCYGNISPAITVNEDYLFKVELRQGTDNSTSDFAVVYLSGYITV